MSPRTKKRNQAPVHPAQLSGTIIKALVHFAESKIGLKTAQNIVIAKLRNCRNLLTNYRQSRQRSGDATALELAEIQSALAQSFQQARQASDTQSLFLVEARAASVYWRAIRQICFKHSVNWQRIYPRASDPLNKLLNMGYTILFQQRHEVIMSAGLLPQLGVLHGLSTPKPLVFDLAEIFRQNQPLIA